MPAPAVVLAACLAGCTAVPPPGSPTVETAAAPVPPAAPDGALYRALGGQAGIVRIVETFVARNLADPRTAATFAGINVANLRKHLVEQFCQVSGGPCDYTGDDMRTVHQGYDITRPQFNAVVENLQAAMSAQGIPFAAQNRFLALLAPMHRDIVIGR